MSDKLRELVHEARLTAERISMFAAALETQLSDPAPAEQPLFTASMYGSAERANEARKKWEAEQAVIGVDLASGADTTVVSGPCEHCGKRTSFHLHEEAEQAKAGPRKAIATAPKRIYLQINDDDADLDEEFPHIYSDQVTWCTDSVMVAEVPYVRADLVTQPASAEVPALAWLEAAAEFHGKIVCNDTYLAYYERRAKELAAAREGKDNA